MIVLGIDGDMKTPGFAIVRDRAVIFAGVLQGNTLKELVAAADPVFWELNVKQGVMLDAIIVEGQQVYTHGPYKTPDPARIVALAQVAGALAAKALDQWPLADLDMPRPADWKGQTSKDAHQAWLCEQVGWKIGKRLKGGVRPDMASVGAEIIGVPSGDSWYDLMDAVGLAWYGATKKVWR